MEASLPACHLLCSMTRFIGFGWRVTSVLLPLLVLGFIGSCMVLRTSCCRDEGTGTVHSFGSSDVRVRCSAADGLWQHVGGAVGRSPCSELLLSFCCLEPSLGAAASSPGCPPGHTLSADRSSQFFWQSIVMSVWSVAASLQSCFPAGGTGARR